MSAKPSARRNFLRGRFRRLDKDMMRPPWAVADLPDLCSHCGDCARSCPQGIIVADDDHYPIVDLRRNACTFCRACADACQTGALDPAQSLDWPWLATVSDACLSAQGVHCRACEDSCDEQAIRFQLATGGRSFVRIDFDQCTGCGGCATVCPAHAVGFVRRRPDKETATE